MMGRGAQLVIKRIYTPLPRKNVDYLSGSI